MKIFAIMIFLKLKLERNMSIMVLSIVLVLGYVILEEHIMEINITNL